MADESTNTDLREAVVALEEAELLWLLEHTTQQRNGFAEGRPRVAEFFNAVLAVLDDDQASRPARRHLEIEQIGNLFYGLNKAAEPPEGEGDCGWTADRKS